MSDVPTEHQIKALRHAARMALLAINQYQAGAAKRGCDCAFCKAKIAIKNAMEVSK